MRLKRPKFANLAINAVLIFVNVFISLMGESI